MTQDINLKFGASLSGGAKAVFASLANGLKKVAMEMQKLAKEQLKLGKKDAAMALNETAKGITKLSTELKKGVKETKNYTKSQDALGKSGGRLQSIFKKLGTSMQTYARYMVSSNIMLSIIGLFKSATGAIIEYDQALHDLKAITQASTVETLLLGASIVYVAALTKFSMGEVAGAMKKLGQAGFTASEITKMIGGIAELATGSLESLEVTVGIISTAIRVFGIDVSKTAGVIDIFANAVTRSRLTVAGLATTFNYIGPIAAATGLSLKDTSAAMMLLANSGLRFSTIGTGLRRIIGGLAKPSGKFKDAILAAGYSLADFNPNLTDFRDILTQLPDVVKDSTDAISFFGYRGSSVISAFSTQGVKEYDRLRKAVDRVGTASEMAAEQMKGLQNAIKNVKDRFGVLAKTLSEGGVLTIFKGLVETIRSLLTVLIFLADSVIGKVVLTLGLLTAAAVVATTAFLAFKTIGLGAILIGWVSGIVATTSAFTGVGIAAFTASTGVVTLSSAFAGLLATVVAFLATPIGLAILAITGAFVSFLAIVKANEKALISLTMESEKYSSILDKTIGKMENYNEAVKKYGKDSKEANKEALKLREGVMTLADEYKDIADPLYEFTKRVDENTGSILGSKDAISDLKNVLSMEYEASILNTIAATEKLTGVSKLSAEQIEANTLAYISNGKVVDSFVNKWKKLQKMFGVTFDIDPLNLEGIKKGIAVLDDLQARIKNNDTKAIERNKKLREGGEQLFEILEKRGVTQLDLSKMTNEQILEEILGIEQLTNAHTVAAAALFDILKKKRDFYSPEIEKRNQELKDLAVIKEGYKAFGLTMDGVSIQLKKWMVQFKNLRVITGKHAVSTDLLVKSFEKVGNAVKTQADFSEFTEALEVLRKHTGMTESDLLRLEEIAKKAFEGIRSSASDFKTILDEEFRLFSIDEQKEITTEWQNYVASINTENAITEKTHNKNLEEIHLEYLRKKMVSINIYYNSLKGKYKVDGFIYQQALLDKLKADQAYLKAQSDFIKPDTSGVSKKGKTNEMKLKEELFEAALDRQKEASKTMNLELKASYDTQVKSTKQYYAEKRVLAEEYTDSQVKLIEERMIETEKEFKKQADLQTEKEVRDTINFEATKKRIELQGELDIANEKGAQALAKLTSEEYKALQVQERKIEIIQEEVLRKTEASRMDIPLVTDAEKFQIKLDQLKRYNADKLQLMVDNFAKTWEIELVRDLQEEELANLKLAREKEIFQQRLDSAAQFGGDLASITSNLMAAGILQSKKFFKAYQAFAIAETIISTYSAAQTAYDNAIKIGGPFGTPMAVIAAGAAIAAGMAKVVKIRMQSASTGYAEGGLIGGRGGPKEDNIRINASKGEFIEQAKAVRHYGVGVMEGLNNLTIPKSLFEGFTKRKKTAQSSYNFAEGGLVANLSKNDDGEIMSDIVEKINNQKQPINIMNIVNPVEILQNALATPEGKGAIFNLMSSNKRTMQRILV